MVNWIERAQAEAQRTRQEAVETKIIKIDEEDRRKQAQEQERQRLATEKRKLIRDRAEKTQGLVVSLDRIPTDAYLREIQAQAWEGRGQVESEPIYFDEIIIGRNISLIAEVPTRAGFITEDLYRTVRKVSTFSKTSGMGEFIGSETVYGEPETKVAGHKLIGVGIFNSAAILSVEYGFDLRTIQELWGIYQGRSALRIRFSNTNGQISEYKKEVPLLDPDTQALDSFTTQALALTVADLMKDPFPAQIERAKKETERLKSRIGEHVFFSSPYEEISPTWGGVVRGFLGRK